MDLKIKIFNELACLELRDDLLCAWQEASDSDAYFYEMADKLESPDDEVQRLLVDALRNTYSLCIGEVFDAGVLYGMAVARELERMEAKPVKMLEEYTKHWPSAREEYPIKEKSSDRVDARETEENAKFNN
ncbi:hypothetical protein [Eubacterium callanderi]|uniref:hypothetical protein n=1 Tax=Eubacterium callanderi TaxID=53442 RepID=UPI001AA1B7D9|nr:hypothetical protein [Eubacterium callanderi]MBO1704223.1 hypothetical protein [Eubacterium callanderi]